MKNKKLIIATAAAGLVGAVGVGATALADTSASADNGQSSLVQKIADRFHLNKTDVQKVFDEQKQANQQERQQKLSIYLDTKVKDGTITQAQKDTIVAKLDQLHKQFASTTPQDRRANHQKIHDELTQWAKDNGINLDNLLPHGIGSHGGHNPGG